MGNSTWPKHDSALQQHDTDLTRIRSKREQFRLDFEALTKQFESQLTLLTAVTAD